MRRVNRENIAALSPFLSLYHIEELPKRKSNKESLPSECRIRYILRKVLRVNRKELKRYNTENIASEH